MKDGSITLLLLNSVASEESAMWSTLFTKNKYCSGISTKIHLDSIMWAKTMRLIMSIVMDL